MLGSYFMAAMLAAAGYSRGCFSPCLAVSVRRVMVPGGSTFHLEPGTVDILVTSFLLIDYLGVLSISSLGATKSSFFF